jgi:hypothetical protein
VKPVACHKGLVKAHPRWRAHQIGGDVSAETSSTRPAGESGRTRFMCPRNFEHLTRCALRSATEQAHRAAHPVHT